MKLRHCLFLCAVAAAPLFAQVDAPPSVPFTELPLNQLSGRSSTPLGQKALAIRASDWKHAETPNFVYHFFHSFIAAPVSAEAEFYYRITARELGKETAQWERKCHVFIFESSDDWAQFQTSASLDPWTGGIHANGELFIQRDPKLRWKGHTLAHEIVHLVVHRFFGAGVPLWLNEGYAEYAGGRGYATFHRARGFNAKPRAQAVDPARFIPIAQLTGAAAYPADPLEVATFYDESERLVRFLSGIDKRGFITFLDALAKGNRIESALTKSFGARFSDIPALEREFRVYAIKEHTVLAAD